MEVIFGLGIFFYPLVTAVTLNSPPPQRSKTLLFSPLQDRFRSAVTSGFVSPFELDASYRPFFFLLPFFPFDNWHTHTLSLSSLTHLLIYFLSPPHFYSFDYLIILEISTQNIPIRKKKEVGNSAIDLGRLIVLSSYLGQDLGSREPSVFSLFPFLSLAPSPSSWGSPGCFVFLFYSPVLIRAYDCVTKSAYIASSQSGYLTATQAPRWGRNRPGSEHRVPTQNHRAATGIGPHDDYARPGCHGHATLDQDRPIGCCQAPAALAHLRISSKETVQVVARWGCLDHRTAWEWDEVGGYQQTTPRPQCHQLPSSLSELPGTPKWMGRR